MKDKINNLVDVGIGCMAFAGGVILTIWIVEFLLTLIFGQA